MALRESFQGKIYDCKHCDYALKKKRGCIKARKRAVATFDCLCKGEDDDCEICKGSGTFGWCSCPNTVLSDVNIRRTVSYFYHFQAYSVYPNGKGLYYQPVKMLEAFNILGDLYFRYKEKESPDGK